MGGATPTISKIDGSYVNPMQKPELNISLRFWAIDFGLKNESNFPLCMGGNFEVCTCKYITKLLNYITKVHWNMGRRVTHYSVPLMFILQRLEYRIPRESKTAFVS